MQPAAAAVAWRAIVVIWSVGELETAAIGPNADNSALGFLAGRPADRMKVGMKFIIPIRKHQSSGICRRGARRSVSPQVRSVRCDRPLGP